MTNKRGDTKSNQNENLKSNEQIKAEEHINELQDFAKNLINPIEPSKFLNIKTPWVKHLLVGSLLAITFLIGGNLILGSMQQTITGVSAEYRQTTNTKKTPYATILQQFRLNGNRTVIFNYLTTDGLKFVLYDLDNKQVLKEDLVSSSNVKANSIASLAQVFNTQLSTDKAVTNLNFTKSGFEFNDEKYDVTMHGPHVTKINGKDIKISDVYLVSESHLELINRNKISTSDLIIQYIDRDPITNHFVITALDSEERVYIFDQDDIGKVKLKIHEVE